MKKIKETYILLGAIALVFALYLLTCVVVSQGDYEEMTGLQRRLYSLIHREEICNTQYIGEVSTEKWTADAEYRVEDTSVVLKESGEDFVVMNISDLHMSDYSAYDDVNYIMDNRTLYYLRMMAEEIQPDMITISADIFREDEGSIVYAAHRLTEYLDSLQIPWAPIFDTHDKASNCDLNYLADIMMESKYCLLKKGDPEMGVGNYVVNIYEETDGKLDVVHSILMMYTHGGNLWDNQIEWYKWAAEGVSEIAGNDVTSTVVMHVPFAQYVYAYNEAWDAESERWKDGYDAFGVKREEECGERDENGEPIDNGFFDAILEVGTTTNTICGHDHINSYSIVYEGVRLTYSLRLGGGNWDENTGVTTLTIDDEGNGVVEHHYVY